MSTKESAKIFLRSPLKMQEILERIHADIDRKMRDHPVRFLTEATLTASNKPLIRGDIVAEEAFCDAIYEKCGDVVVVEGEESLGHHGLDLEQSDNLHVLCDIIDGTDLMMRGFSNWCSAIVCFDPSKKEIISAFVYAVGGRQSSLYSASAGSEQVLRVDYLDVLERSSDGIIRPKKVRDTTAELVENHKRLEDATICAYGQKIKNMLLISDLFSSSDNRAFFDGLKKARFYNLAGNPMMCRLLDGAVDLVFDVGGQSPHDVVPGAYVALKGGAYMFDLGKNPLRQDRTVREVDLVHHLYRPSDPEGKMKYVISANKNLGLEFIDRCAKAGVF